MAEREGFEPSVHLTAHLISSQGRYNHFDISPCGRRVSRRFLCIIAYSSDNCKRFSQKILQSEKTEKVGRKKRKMKKHVKLLEDENNDLDKEMLKKMSGYVKYLKKCRSELQQLAA